MDAWSETDSDKQSGLLKKALSKESQYTDPLTEESLKGLDAVQAYIQQTQTMVPGVNLKLKTYVQHHDFSLAEWDMCDEGGRVMSQGKSFARYDESQKIIETVAFFAV